ncbi:MAG: TraR/DksA family transcriptional regulator [SAR324 cluster bacterium]|nr:TraR/DksA family transcriptional regulator [SAR324 cluster bacterium]
MAAKATGKPKAPAPKAKAAAPKAKSPTPKRKAAKAPAAKAKAPAAKAKVPSPKAKASKAKAPAPKGKAAKAPPARAAKAKAPPVPAKKKVAAKAIPKGRPKPTGPRLAHIDNKTLAKIVTKLEEMRAESVRVVNTHVQEDLQPREETGEVGDDLDQASNERAREFSFLMHQRHLRRLQQIDEAFERIEGGSFGLCEGTEEPINPKRLLIMPLARFSLEFQQMQEKMLGRSPEDTLDQADEAFMREE